MSALVRGAALAAVTAAALVPVAAARAEDGAGPATFEDATIHVDLPDGWTVEGADGEYRLESEGPDVASLLVLTPGTDRGLEARLADIEAQFLSTGLFRLDRRETRFEDGEAVHYRGYTLVPAPPLGDFGDAATPDDSSRGDEAGLALHQYLFERAGTDVLLQVETAPGGFPPDDLAFRIFHTLEVRLAPVPFRWDVRGESESTDRS